MRSRAWRRGDATRPRRTLAASVVSGAYAFPALAGLGVMRRLRPPLGIADHTLDGRGYGLTFDDGPHREGTPAVLEALAARAVREDMLRGAARIEETTGAPIVRYRPPYGIFNAAALALAHANGWRPLLWTHWGRDWQARATPDSIFATLVGARVGEGSVLLLHDADDYSAEGSWRRTAAALPRVLAELEARGMSWSLEV